MVRGGKKINKKYFMTIVYIIIVFVLFIILISVILAFISGLNNREYARRMCELQKQACAENFKDKSKDNTKYRTAVLNTKNVVK